MKADPYDSILHLSGDKSRRFGTAFVVHRDEAKAYLLTCAHVIDNCTGDERQIRASGFPARVVAMGKSDNLDLAVLSVDGLLDAPPLRVQDRGEEGRHFAVLGFRSYQRHHALERVRGRLGHRVILESSETQREPGRVAAWSLQLKGDDTLLQGFSGSPVIDEATQDVLGVVSYREGKGQKGVAISIKAIPVIWPDGPPIVSGETPVKDIRALWEFPWQPLYLVVFCSWKS